ncbi:MAG: Na+/H+ antiporter [Thermodesulfobacteriota bacterium]
MQELELILILLAVAAGLSIVANRLSIPFPSLLVLGGLLLALTPGLPYVELDPDTVFLIFVPPLLYWAAFLTSYFHFRKNLFPILNLGIVLVLVTMCVVAWVAHAVIPELTWSSAFVLGAIVSGPDAVSVTAVTSHLPIRRTISVILDGESLINDATAFVAYRMAVTAVIVGGFSLQDAGIRFLWTAAGGTILGLAIGWFIVWLRVHIRNAPFAESTVSLLTPYAAFIPAEHLGVSGVLAVVATGLYLSWKGPRIISARTRLQAAPTWQMLNFLLEGLIFIIVGLELPVIRGSIIGYHLSVLILYTVIMSVTLILVRVVYMFLWACLTRLFGRLGLGKRGKYPPWRGILLLGWAGIRGGDSLVIALALPLLTQAGAPFPGRNLIIFLTFAIILVTLVLQGFTLAPLIRRLKLHSGGEDRLEESKARFEATNAALRLLDELAKKEWAPAKVVNDLRERFENRAELWGKNNQDADSKHYTQDAIAYSRLFLQMVDAERTEIIKLRDEGEISDDVLRRIQHDLDLEETLVADSKVRIEADEHNV